MAGEKTVVLTGLLAVMVGAPLLLLLCDSSKARAGCGCDKLPPEPAAVVQRAAFPGMSITLLYGGFRAGQVWSIVFQGEAASASVSAEVVSLRDLTNPASPVPRAQLLVMVPELPMGPTSISAHSDTDAFVVPDDAFTVIGKPLAISEQTSSLEVQDYEAAVGHDGTIYVSVGGLDRVCSAMRFRARMNGVPLRIDAAAIYNVQGFFIDALGLANQGIFSINSNTGEDRSDVVKYFRHSFAQYCADHRPGGAKEIDRGDPNWHADGTAHVEYSTLIFALGGHLDDGSVPQPGSMQSEKTTVETDLGAGVRPWEEELEEEYVVAP